MNLILFLILVFPHSPHIQNGVECLTCHDKAKTSTLSSDVLLPGSDVCQDCHGESKGYKKPQMLPIWIYRFTHQGHKDQSCLICHENVENPVLPKMETCIQCHNDVTASKDCFTCHSWEEAKRGYHPPEWKRLHSEEARLEREKCLLCHEESSTLNNWGVPACENCHVRENIALQRHPENFLFEHPAVFETRVEDCSSCHYQFEDCRSCHYERRIYPMDHSSLNWVADEGGEHKTEAESDPEKCLSCHGGEDPICATCH
jgi:hypothetical protein